MHSVIALVLSILNTPPLSSDISPVPPSDAIAFATRVMQTDANVGFIHRTTVTNYGACVFFIPDRKPECHENTTQESCDQDAETMNVKHKFYLNKTCADLSK